LFAEFPSVLVARYEEQPEKYCSVHRRQVGSCTSSDIRRAEPQSEIWRKLSARFVKVSGKLVCFAGLA
jgi:hypothetical protein